MSIFGHISSSIGPITPIWLSLKRYLPPAEVEYRRRPFWWSKGQGSSWAVTGGTGVSGLKCGYENFWSRVIFCKIFLVTVDKLGGMASTWFGWTCYLHTTWNGVDISIIGSSRWLNMIETRRIHVEIQNLYFLAIFILVYTTQVNSAFRALWLVNSEVISKYYSPPSNRRERFLTFRPLVTHKTTFWSANYSACVVDTKTIIHLSIGESDGYLPPLRWIIVN